MPQARIASFLTYMLPEGLLEPFVILNPPDMFSFTNQPDGKVYD
jgi:hypothetical protein